MDPEDSDKSRGHMRRLCSLLLVLVVHAQAGTIKIGVIPGEIAATTAAQLAVDDINADGALLTDHTLALESVAEITTGTNTSSFEAQQRNPHGHIILNLTDALSFDSKRLSGQHVNSPA